MLTAVLHVVDTFTIRDFYNGETYIWYTQKHKWRRGPRLPEDLVGPFTGATVNATSVLLIFHPAPLRSYLYDFENEKLLEYPFLDLNNTFIGTPFISLQWLSLTTVVSKEGRM